MWPPFFCNGRLFLLFQIGLLACNWSSQHYKKREESSLNHDLSSFFPSPFLLSGKVQTSLQLQWDVSTAAGVISRSHLNVASIQTACWGPWLVLVSFNRIQKLVTGSPWKSGFGNGVRWYLWYPRVRCTGPSTMSSLYLLLCASSSYLLLCASSLYLLPCAGTNFFTCAPARRSSLSFCGRHVCQFRSFFHICQFQSMVDRG